MSWSELERLVEEAEGDGAIRRALRRCRSRAELVLAARRLGYFITPQDLQSAGRLHTGDVTPQIAAGKSPRTSNTGFRSTASLQPG
jgi:hypothetical protein